MSRIPVIIDLIAGVLLAVDVFAPKWGNISGKWIIRQIPDSNEANNPLHLKNIFFSFMVTLFVFGMIVLWALLKESSSNTSLEILVSVGLYAAGAFGGAFTIILVAAVVSRYVGLFHNFLIYVNTKFLKRDSTQQTEAQLNRQTIYVTWTLSFILVILLLNIIKIIAPVYSFTTPILISSIYVVALLPTAIMCSPSLRKFVDAPPDQAIYVIARIGLVLFISSKFIQIVS